VHIKLTKKYTKPGGLCSYTKKGIADKKKHRNVYFGMGKTGGRHLSRDIGEGVRGGDLHRRNKGRRRIGGKTGKQKFGLETSKLGRGK